jgi:sn-glycerol 3-phosphate transport system substrate-binding protein
MRHRSRFVAVALGVALFAAACSSDDSGSDTAATTSSLGAGAGAGASISAAPTTTALKFDPKQCPTAALDSVSSPVPVTFWHAMTEQNEKTLTALTDKYNASQTKVKVTLQYQGTYDDTVTKYVAAVRGGDLPQMVQMEETAMQLMLDSKSTVPIAACISSDKYDTSDFAPRLFGQYSVGDVVVTMPFQLSNPVLYYNKAAFVRAGLDPEKPPTTLDEVLDASRKIVATKATPKAFSLQAQSWYPEQWVSMAGEAVVDHDNGRAARATTALLDGKTFTSVFAWIEAMQKEGLIKYVGRDEKLTDALLAVATEDVAMTIGTSAALGTIYSVLPQFPKVQIGVAPLPGPSGNGGITVGGGSLYMVNKGSDQEKAGVWDYMKFLDSVDSQVAWHIGTGYIPTRLSAASRPEVQQLWKDKPGYKVAYDQLSKAGTPVGGGGPVIGDYVGFRNVVENSIEQIVNGSPAAGVQKQAQEAANKAIKDYNTRVGG